MKIKNLKISVEVHSLLKKYCDQKGLKINKFVEKLIEENCKIKKDIYGEN
jgi:predicted HicB family RNase H-like nuclease